MTQKMESASADNRPASGNQHNKRARILTANFTRRGSSVIVAILVTRPRSRCPRSLVSIPRGRKESFPFSVGLGIL